MPTSCGVETRCKPYEPIRCYNDLCRHKAFVGSPGAEPLWLGRYRSMWLLWLRRDGKGRLIFDTDSPSRAAERWTACKVNVLLTDGCRLEPGSGKCYFGTCLETVRSVD